MPSQWIYRVTTGQTQKPEITRKNLKFNGNTWKMVGRLLRNSPSDPARRQVANRNNR